jgi:hypothetical protein
VIVLVEISEDLKEIVSSTIESIKEGMKGKGCGLGGPIEFELSVIKTKAAQGGFKFLIADASGNYAKESLSKISFKIMSSRDSIGTRIAGIWLTEEK